MSQYSQSETTINEFTIYTIGHSNTPISKLINLLKEFNIDILIDVRTSPYSRHAYQFNRENLARSLRDHGIDYDYAGNLLGGRPDDPACYKNHTIPEGSADYLNLVDYPTVMEKDFFLEGIKRIYSLTNHGCVVLMCSEEDPAICHRHHLIGRYLVNQGIKVIHIRGDGNTVKDQLLPNLPNDPPAEQLNLLLGGLE